MSSKKSEYDVIELEEDTEGVQRTEDILSELQSELDAEDFEVDTQSDRFLSIDGDGWELSVQVRVADHRTADIGLFGERVSGTIERPIPSHRIVEAVADKIV